jgi:hypothetical protein
MKNYLLPVLFLVVFPCILLSCKKKEQISFPQTLYASNIVNTSGIRMFTNGSENKDTTMIKKYIGNSEYFNLTTVDPSAYITLAMEIIRNLHFQVINNIYKQLCGQL